MCGIGGAWGPEAARLVLAMEPWLLHRGHEGVGYAYLRNGELKLGRPPEDAEAAVIHTRYSTTGPYQQALQPVLAKHRDMELALVFNGTIVNYRRLDPKAKFDGEALAKALAREVWELGLEQGVASVYAKLVGAASLIALTHEGILTVRDVRGIRPLAVKQHGGSFAAASETVALDGGLELAPGTAVFYGRRIATWKVAEEPAQRLCALEYVYFAHFASELGGKSVYAVRRELGRALAEAEEVADAIDVVTYVPETARVIAEAYASALGKPLVEAVVKSRFAGRIFISPPHARSPATAFKVLRGHVEGRGVALVDDSLIRGTNIRAVVKMLREVGAREVHVRIASPPVKWPCFFGMDFQTRRELAAYARSVEAVRHLVGADTLAYLPLDKFRQILGGAVCYACFTGEYPVAIDVEETERELARAPPSRRLAETGL